LLDELDELLLNDDELDDFELDELDELLDELDEELLELDEEDTANLHPSLVISSYV